jgi:PAS domain S-box-containing protein
LLAAAALALTAMPPSRPEWLLTTVNAVRELMIQRLEKHSLDPDAEREMQMALEELEVMWEELEGQAEILTREHKRYSEFFEFAPDAYLITDAGGNVREANCAATELLAMARDDLVGRPLSQLLDKSDRVSFLSNLVGMLVGATPNKQWSALVQPGEGAPRLCEFAVRAIPLQKSGVAGLCWLIRPA